MHKLTAAFLLGGLALSVNAAEPRLGAVGAMAGNVSVGGDGFVTKAVYGTPLVEGSTVMVSSDGRAKLVLTNGCTISLRGSQYVTVTATLGCSELQASVQQMMTPYRVAQTDGTVGPGATGAGGAGALSPLFGFGLVAGVAGTARIVNDGPVSGQ